MLFMILIIHGASARYQECNGLNQFSPSKGVIYRRKECMIP
ncbi:hypothetical protein T01_8690 [Trichinella spiralis]|uniref:Uncharacterized protein n=1 Tax=Trichinella spiralis TaxID=6334 RepID=A0A0V1AK26_TRISP|nr:hypothetical protein T01_8690 [Trichinella spiralis]